VLPASGSLENATIASLPSKPEIDIRFVSGRRNYVDITYILTDGLDQHPLNQGIEHALVDLLVELLLIYLLLLLNVRLFVVKIFQKIQKFVFLLVNLVRYLYE
jgi:hypothetical protein